MQKMVFEHYLFVPTFSRGTIDSRGIRTTEDSSLLYRPQHRAKLPVDSGELLAIFG